MNLTNQLAFSKQFHIKLLAVLVMFYPSARKSLYSVLELSFLSGMHNAVQVDGNMMSNHFVRTMLRMQEKPTDYCSIDVIDVSLLLVYSLTDSSSGPLKIASTSCM